MRRFPLIAILLIGILTPVFSTALFFFWRPSEQVNIGELLLPPQALAATHWQNSDGSGFSPQQWNGYWVLLSAGGGACDEQCRLRLCKMRQLRLMLPGNYLRLRRAWLVTDDTSPPLELLQKTGCGEVENTALQLRDKDTLDGVEIIYTQADLPSFPAGESEQPYLYLLDPAGVWVMRFSPELGTYQIQKDLKRLLKISKGRRIIEQ
ncbi:MAG: hypothetical protein K0U15_02955 [Proteobacteria bacterium]|nr:hypothetical protein [Pseudomonadota bacterium]MCH9757914.1 hypothetical protein [Pseudomonadota bacterium]